MQPQVRSVTPILPVEDISATLAYYKNVLGVTQDWEWGDPPNHAGCMLGSVELHFTLEPELCRSSRGLSLFLNVLHIEELYERHIANGATIVGALEPKPWGVKEYDVEDCNGVRLRFAQSGFLEGRKEPVEGVTIVERKLAPHELRDLMIAVHWQIDDEEESLLRAVTEPIFTAAAEFEGRCVGVGSILRLEPSYYVIFNVIVHPDFQSQGVGKRIMASVDRWLTENGMPGAMVKLFTGLDRQEFYGQFGFQGPERGLVGMTKVLKK